MSMMPAAEGPVPLQTDAPPDQAPTDLAGAFAMVDAILWRDGGIDQNEAQIAMAWFKQFMLKAQASMQQAQQQGGAAAPNPALGGSSATQSFNPLGGGSAPTQDAQPFAGM